MVLVEFLNGFLVLADPERLGDTVAVFGLSSVGSMTSSSPPRSVRHILEGKGREGKENKLLNRSVDWWRVCQCLQYKTLNKNEIYVYSVFSVSTKLY